MSWEKALQGTRIKEMQTCDCGKPIVPGSIFCHKCKQEVLKTNEQIMGYKPFEFFSKRRSGTHK